MRKHAASASLIAVGLIALALGCDRRDPVALKTSAQRSAGPSLSRSDDPSLSRSDDEDEGAGICAVAGLHGGYGFLREGTTTAGPLAAVGVMSYDGAGNWTATQSLSRNGTFSFDETTSGTYTVNSDCSGKLFSAGQEIGRIMVIDGGKTVFQLDETAQSQVIGRQKRAPRQCSNATLEGDFGFYRSGITATGPLASVGRGHLDGAGNGSAVQTNIRNGVINPDQVLDPTPYEVSADCSGKLFFGGREIGRLVVVDKGREFYIMSESAGNTVSGVERAVGKD
jgi:hypothetical protein